MAKVFPARLPEEVRRDRRRNAECRVFEALKTQLGPDFMVFYSSPWLGTRPDGSEVDGEADFVVAHPDLGMLIIEVKGGRIRIDADNQWKSTDRAGITYRIRNPVEQARTGKHELLKKLKRSPLWEARWIAARHGVVLPDCARPVRDLRPDMPLRLFAFQEDLGRLEDWVRSRFADTSGEQEHRTEQGLGLDGLRALEDMIARPIQLRVKLSTNVHRDLKAIGLLTDDQIWILRELEDNRRMAIAGAAGTGKTILALQKACLLAEQGCRVLLLCFNRPLSVWLRRMRSGCEQVEIFNFHQFVHECAVKAGRVLPAAPGKEKPAADEGLSRLLVESFAEAGLEEYDAVIVDEGQDFRDDWLQALDCVEKDAEEGILYVFYDDNQNVMWRAGAYLNSLKVARYRLRRNFRNTKAIFREADRYYSGDTVRPIGPDGAEVRWYGVPAGVSLRSRLAERIGSLVSNEGVSPEEIAVLLPDRKLLSAMLVGDRIGRYRLVSAGESSDECITADTVRRFKGLESPVVLLVLSVEMKEEKELLYTGMTRAQSLLEVIGPERMIGRLKSGDQP